MEAVYYYDKEEKQCPVDKFLKEKIKKCPTLNKQRKERIGVDLIGKINQVKGKNGKPDGGIAEPVKGYGFNKIKQAKDQDKLIRILYFCYDDLMVLLYAFEKPRRYRGKKPKKEEERHYEIANEYCKKFKKNPKSYKKI